MIVISVLDPEKLAALLSKTIHEAHARTCLLTKEQIQELWLQGIDQQKLFIFKNMVRMRIQSIGIYCSVYKSKLIALSFA
jgi:hypothetical protein